MLGHAAYGPKQQIVANACLQFSCPSSTMADDDDGGGGTERQGMRTRQRNKTAHPGLIAMQDSDKPTRKRRTKEEVAAEHAEKIAAKEEADAEKQAKIEVLALIEEQEQVDALARKNALAQVKSSNIYKNMFDSDIIFSVYRRIPMRSVPDDKRRR